MSIITLLIQTLLSVCVRWLHLLYQQICFTVEVSVNECKAHLADNNRVCVSCNYVTDATF